MDDQWGAFCSQDVHLEALNSGSLDGYTFAAKDVFAVQGIVAGAGSPDWKRTHLPATQHAHVIHTLLNDGATFIGTTQSDELMFSLSGENYHYGTPINPKAVKRIPGGSSSGSVVAVSAGLVDFALGTDTGGSIRVPASYCGVYGIRPSHGSVSLDGVIPLAPSFDTVGWFAKDAWTLRQVGYSLMGRDESYTNTRAFQNMLIGKDLNSVLSSEYRVAYDALVQEINQCVEGTSEIIIAQEGLQEWMSVFRTIQGIEVWQSHKDWIAQENPRFGPGVAERFHWSETLDEHALQHALRKREEIKEHLHHLLSDDRVLVLPTVPSVAPLRNTPPQQIEKTRTLTLQLCCVAGLSGLPQVSLPWLEMEGAPLGISFIAGPGQDLRLLNWVTGIANQIKGYSSVQSV